MRFGIVIMLILGLVSGCGSSKTDETLDNEVTAQSLDTSSDIVEGSVDTTSSGMDANLTDEDPGMVDASSSGDETLEAETETETETEAETETQSAASSSGTADASVIDSNLTDDNPNQIDVITDSMTRVGVFSLERVINTDETVVRSSASFFVYEPTPDVRPVGEQIEIIRPDDSCLVAQNALILNRGLPRLPDLILGDGVSAGETLTLTSPSGTYASVNRVVYAGPNAPENPPIYYSDLDLPAPVPLGLTLSAPGETFPAFELAIPDIPLVTGLSPTLANDVNNDTFFTWDASGNPNAIVTIFAANFPENGDENAQSAMTICEVKDDGNFAFPESTKAELGNGFVATQYKLTRSVLDVVKDGETYILLYNGEVPY